MTKRKLRIVFMGTPQFAVASLKALIDYNYNIVAVITAPDRPAGRGQKLKASAVKEFATKHKLKTLQPTNLKSPSFIEELKQLKSNLHIVVAFRMLPKAVWSMPKYGTFNLHASLLPQYRGAAPIHWAIINGETTTGVTTFFIDEKIDTGAIIKSEKIDINKDETLGSLQNRLMDLGSNLVVKTVKLIENNTVQSISQPQIHHLKKAHKLTKENCKIDWNHSLDKIYNKIRGLNPYPVAWCYLQNEDKKLMVKLFDVVKFKESHTLEAGAIYYLKSEFKVACKGGYIGILSMQLPGKRKMDIKSILNGLRLSKDAKLF